MCSTEQWNKNNRTPTAIVKLNIVNEKQKSVKNNIMKRRTHSYNNKKTSKTKMNYAKRKQENHWINELWVGIQFTKAKNMYNAVPVGSVLFLLVLFSLSLILFLFCFFNFFFNCINIFLLYFLYLSAASTFKIAAYSKQLQILYTHGKK